MFISQQGTSVNHVLVAVIHRQVVRNDRLNRRCDDGLPAHRHNNVLQLRQQTCKGVRNGS
jgi:hypothetical protein